LKNKTLPEAADIHKSGFLLLHLTEKNIGRKTGNLNHLYLPEIP